MNKHKGKRRVQKRPNYKNVGEEEDEEKGPAEDAQDDAEKAKGTEGGSKGIKTSGENEGECAASQAVICVWSPLVCQPVRLSIPDTCVPHSVQPAQPFGGRSGTRPVLTGRVTWNRVLYP